MFYRRKNEVFHRTTGSGITPSPTPPAGRGASSDIMASSSAAGRRSSHALLVARSASLLLLLTTAAVATTSTSTSATACSAELETCDGDAACSTCASSAGDENTVSLDDCSARYPDVFLVGSEGSTAGYCESIGAAYCCAFADSDTAFDCMNGDDAAGGATTTTAAQGYWGCLLAEDDCSLEDMPCYGDPVTDAPTAAPSPVIIVIMPPGTADDSTAGPTTSLSPSATDDDDDAAAPTTDASPLADSNETPSREEDNEGSASGESPTAESDAASTSGGVVVRAGSPCSVVVELAGTLGLLVVVAGMFL